MVTKAGAEFTGLAIGKTAGGHKRLFAADGAHGVVRAYNSQFQPIDTFTDHHARHLGLVPYNVAHIGKRLFVSFALRRASTPTSPASWTSSSSTVTCSAG